MSPSVRALYQRALELPPAKRAELARELIASIERGLAEVEEDEPPVVVAAAWRDEVAKRVREMDEGSVEPVPSKSVHSAARRAIKSARSKRA